MVNEIETDVLVVGEGHPEPGQLSRLIVLALRSLWS
jgi:hypothetical protein